MDKQIYRLIGKATTLAAYVTNRPIFLLYPPRTVLTNEAIAWRTVSDKAGTLLPLPQDSATRARK